MKRFETITNEHKDLVALEKWEEIFQSNDEMRLNEEVHSLKYAMEELKNEVF